MPKISVVMPAYNAEKYIQEAIDSILNQTFSDFEFIIIDDGSTDRTAEIVRSYTDPRIRFVKNERNLGVAATLNRGLELAQGEYIARMDADDISLPKRFEKQVAFMGTHPDVAVLGTGIERFGSEHGEVLFSKSHDELKVDLLFACCFAHPTVMLRAATLKCGGYRYDQSFTRMEDYDLWDRLSEQHMLAALPEVLLRYRMHPLQVTHQKMTEDAQQIRRIKERQLARLGADTTGDGFDSFLAFCNSSFIATSESILLLSRYFDTLKQKNSNKHIYQAQVLAAYLKSVKIGLLNRIPLQDAVSLTGECGVSMLPYAAERVCRGVITRVGGEIRKRKLQSKLRSKDFSIISNNCWGGFVYQKFGLEYKTPTIGLYILGRDFVKFASNMDHYLSHDLEFIAWEDSAYYSCLKDEEPYPVAKLDDIEVYFMHYHSEEEAREKWNRRKQRINRDKMLFKLSEREGCSKEDIENFMALPLKNKICFSYEPVAGAIYVPELEGLKGDETSIVNGYYDIYELLNSIG